MNELVRRLEKEVEVIRLRLERNIKHHDRPFMNNCDHYYKLENMNTPNIYI